MKRPNKTLLLRALVAVLTVITLVAIWQLWIEVADIKQIVMPSPRDVWQILISSDSPIRDQTIATIRHALLGLFVATVVGSLLAVVAWWIKPTSTSIWTLILIAQSIPVIAIAPAFVLWFGLDDMSKYVTVIFVCTVPAFIGAVRGFESMPLDQRDYLSTLGASRFELWRHSALPSAVPQMFAALRINAGLSIVAAVVAEWTGSLDGLGALLQSARRVSDSASVWACVVVLAVLTLTLNGVVALAESRIGSRYRQDFGR